MFLDLKDIKVPAIILSPLSDSWNNFTYRTRFDYRVIESSYMEVQTSGQVHLGFCGIEKSPADIVETYFRKSLKPVSPSKVFPDFYTMHQNMEAYRKIVNQLGPDKAKQLLLNLKDLVAFKRERRLPDWFKAATSSSIFSLSFVRDSETFFTFYNAGSILDGVEHEELKGISNRLHLSFLLPSFQNSHELKFCFEHDSILPQRIAIIIGKNGTGIS